MPFLLGTVNTLLTDIGFPGADRDTITERQDPVQESIEQGREQGKGGRPVDAVAAGQEGEQEGS